MARATGIRGIGRQASGAKCRQAGPPRPRTLTCTAPPGRPRAWRWTRPCDRSPRRPPALRLAGPGEGARAGHIARGGRGVRVGGLTGWLPGACEGLTCACPDLPGKAAAAATARTLSQGKGACAIGSSAARGFLVCGLWDRDGGWGDGMRAEKCDAVPPFPPPPPRYSPPPENEEKCTRQRRQQLPRVRPHRRLATSRDA